MRTPVIIFLAVAVLGGMLWVGLRSKATRSDIVPVAPEASVQPLPVEPVTNRTARVFSRSSHRRAALPADFSTAADATGPWDAKIDEILAADETDSEIGKKLLELYPVVPPEGQADLALEIAARTANQDYGKLANIITNTATPEEVVDVLLSDLLDRPDSVRLPLLLDLARSKTNAKAGEAKDLLEALLGEDYGADWVQWSKKISEWLASHPE